jgi:hypothetical protein
MDENQQRLGECRASLLQFDPVPEAAGLLFFEGRECIAHTRHKAAVQAIADGCIHAMLASACACAYVYAHHERGS